mmetsp:Transcript_41771/g.89691  ORF Transcript_41771/g.89691 Transcript_41771/m.89691 type:complete len:731 (-) Transcript_41771:209-2401(-)|eukprot:CAMPEP_0206450986 /NCGR_PEP_ID=MMETSP0324_2-20121206/19065_1 /ASSEMBLY_ACC=CAM_ASM_000836 /TAXON_ID=2866 /ORGANISM="Crypthecodinium cohnii, Strain Seligo" /LENGTH=730 /DNA_ID=CAMNT_0053920767 /DNA_START=486 /DNA_END=2678 /DNA_ORIENTATION=+
MMPQGVMKSGPTGPGQPQQGVVQNINGMQYVCCVVPMDESGNMQAQLPPGAVTLGGGALPGGQQIPAGAVPVNLGQLQGMSTGMSTANIQQLAAAGIPLAQLGIGTGGNFNQMPTGPNNNHNNSNTNNSNNTFFANRGPPNQMGDQVWGRQQAPSGPRPQRGRSPTGGRDRRNGGGGNGQAPGAWPQQQGGPQQQQQQPQPERDWASLRNSAAGSPKIGGTNDRPTTFAQLQRERRQSAERRNSTERRTSNERRNNFGADRRTSAERRFLGGADRRTSAERRNFAADRRHSAERRRSTERRFSRERRFSQERRAKSMGPSASYHNRQVELSRFWQQRLPNGKNVQVWVVADQQALSQAAYRLNYLQPGTVTAFELHGVNLASGGTLCLASVAFDDISEPARNVVIFDVLQLGEQFQILGEFLSNNISKLVYDVDTHAKICAQQFGMNMNRVFHAQSAFSLLRGRNPETMVELLEWCGTSSPNLKQTSVMMDRVPELWTHRPLSRDTLNFAVEYLCSMLDSGHSLFNRLVEQFGASAEQKITSASEQRVNEAAQRGWELRNAGFTGEPHDPELNNWLARRFGQTQANLRSGDDTFHDAVRVGDSPRTASWRATVAQMGGASSRGMSRPRQRSSSPSLATWIARRNNLKPDSSKIHRASSLPPNPSGFISDGNPPPTSSNVKNSPQMRASVEPMPWDTQEHKNWADAADEEQANQEIDNVIREVERNRQAEL